MKSKQSKLAIGRRFRNLIGPSFAVADEIAALSTGSSDLP